MKTIPFALLLAALAPYPAAARTPSFTDQASRPAPPSGEFTIVAARRAGGVAGGPVEDPAARRIGETVSFGETLIWWDGKKCESWTAKPTDERVLPLNDPNLSDTQLPPVDGPVSAGDRRLNAGWSLTCDGEPLGVLLQVDRRVLVVPTKSGVTNLILEKPLQPEETFAFQKQLKSMKFYSGAPSSEWDEDSVYAVAAYAEYRGAKYRFARPAVTENLLDGLNVVRISGSSIKDRFPDYRPKETPDTLLDYRPSLSGEVAALPAARVENLKDLISALKSWSGKAAQNPGRYEEGNVALGANPKEYVPSDAELMVFEICERIRQIVLNTDSVTLSNTIKEQKVKVRQIIYKHFTFRHVDVMGSGRFFYASEPKAAVIKIGMAK